MNARDEGFMRGYAAALAALANSHHHPHLAYMVAQGEGLHYRDWSKVRLTPFDRQGLREVFENEIRDARRGKGG